MEEKRIQLILNNLDRGDILLRIDQGTATHKAINVGYFFSKSKKKGDLSFVHAAVCVNTPKGDPVVTIVESTRERLTARGLDPNEFPEYIYFQCRDKDISELVGDLASGIGGQDHVFKSEQAAENYSYAYKEALKSGFTKTPKKISPEQLVYLNKLVESFNFEKPEYFCSSLVIALYAMSCLILDKKFVIDLNTSTSPQNLFNFLKDSKDFEL